MLLYQVAFSEAKNPWIMTLVCKDGSNDMPRASGAISSPKGRDFLLKRRNWGLIFEGSAGRNAKGLGKVPPNGYVSLKQPYLS